MGYAACLCLLAPVWILLFFLLFSSPLHDKNDCSLRLRRRGLCPENENAGEIFVVSVKVQKTRIIEEQKIEFRFANYFQDGMVLQRGKPGARVWGFGQINQQVDVDFNGLPLNTTVQEDGRWLIELPAMEAGGPYDVEATSTVNGDRLMLPLRAILFGDVWLCSGQSNMEFQLQQMFNGTEELLYARTYKDSIRFIQMLKAEATSVLQEPVIYQGWAEPSSVSLVEFSAICWAFGRRLHEKLAIPIGLIGSYYGGTPIRAWSPPEVGQQCPKTALTDIEISILEPWLLKYPSDPSVLWNAMLAPLTPLQIKGVLWYQGEADAMGGRPDDYLCLFPAMIAAWRKAFRSATLAFGFVQLGDKNEEEGGTPLVRWHQTADRADVPNNLLQHVFMAVAMDLPDPDSPYDSIHPRYKEEVAQRLVLGAFNVVYGIEVPFQGPTPITLSQSGTHLMIYFDPSPIVVKNNSSHNFEVCCDGGGTLSGKWQDCGSWTSSGLVNSTDKMITLDVSQCQGKGVAFVRYAWKTTPCSYLRCDIYDAHSALPAPPFVLPIEGSKRFTSYNPDKRSSN